MDDPLIPPGRMVFLDAPTAALEAAEPVPSGLGFRACGDLLIAVRGDVLAARLTPETAAQLAAILAAWAEERVATATAAADAGLARVLAEREAAGNA